MNRQAVVSALLLLATTSCKANQGGRDLGRNEVIYPHTRFQTEVAGDRNLFVLPVRDSRDVSALPASNGTFPVIYDSDGRWERPVRMMVDQVLREELLASGMFQALTPKALATDLLLQPTLLRFHSGVIETIEGGRSLAEVTLRLQVYGPEDAPGSRPIWFDRIFTDTQISGVSLVPLSTLLLSGRTLHSVMVQALAGIDGSNVSRTGMPLEPVAGEAAPASAPAGK